MKTTLYLSVLILLFTGCSSEQGNEQVKKEIESVKKSTVADSLTPAAFIKNNAQFIDDQKPEMKWTFSSDGTFKSYSHRTSAIIYSYDGKWSITDNGLVELIGTEGNTSSKDIPPKAIDIPRKVVLIIKKINPGSYIKGIPYVQLELERGLYWQSMN
jgi:hypothetical protein